MTSSSNRIESAIIQVPNTLEAVNEHYHALGVTDGLPIVPPTVEAVQRMLTYTDLDSQELIAALPPQKGQATVEKIAVNAVMAGCLPQHFPVVLTAIQALAEEAYNLYGVLATTMAGTMAIIGSNNAFGTGSPMVIIGPEHAATIAADGFTKPQIKAWLYDHSKILAGRFSVGNYARFTQRGWAADEEITPETLVGSAASAESIHIVVAGGAGKHSCFIPTFGHTQAITRPLVLKDNTPAASIEAFRQDESTLPFCQNHPNESGVRHPQKDHEGAFAWTIKKFYDLCKCFETFLSH